MIKEKLVASLIFCLVFAFLSIVFVRLFESFPLAGTTLGIDNIAYELKNWDVHYSVTDGLRNPPWSVLPLVPIASLLSHQGAWGLLVLLTIVVTIISVPYVRNRWLYLFSVLVVTLSFPTLRNLADANLEGLVIAGVLLLLTGYRRQNSLLLATGCLLATAKPQSTWLLMLTVGLLALQTLPRRSVWSCAGLVAAVVIPTFLWRGRDWLAAVAGTYQAGSIIDISLNAALNRLGGVSGLLTAVAVLAVLILTATIVWQGDRTLSREKATLLLCASMLTAPYVAGNSIATILAIGLIPLMHECPLSGGLMLVLVNLPFFWTREWLFAYQSYWWTLILLSIWGIMGRHVYMNEVKARKVTERIPTVQSWR